MSGEAKNLFISHALRDSAELQRVKNLLEKNGYAFRDSSTDGSMPSEATSKQGGKDTLQARYIDSATVLLVLISPGTHPQPQIDREIQYAQQQGKRIVGVYVRDGKESDLPANFQKYADALVDCQADRVMDAIEGRINTLFMPDGETEFPERDIERYACGEKVPE